MDPTLLNRAAPPGSLRYFAGLYAPEATRDQVYALYAIESEVRDSADSANHDVAHTRLRWWREEIQRIEQGRPQHPASQVIASAATKPDASVLQQMMFAAEIELSRMTFDGERELNAYLERSGGALQEAIAHVTSPTAPNESVRTHARRFGAIARHAEVLRNLRHEARSGRIYLPLQQLTEAKVQHADLSADKVTPALREAIAREAQRSLSEYRRRIRELTRIERTGLRSVLVFTALHAKLLERLARGEYSAHPPLELGGFQRAWTAWRTALAAR
jgi:15-cis-phytoene synthase